MKRLILSIFCLIILFPLFSQPKKRRSNRIEYVNSIQLTVGAGSSTYFGDLCDNFDCVIYRPQTSFGILYRNSDRLLLRNEFTYLRLAGSDIGGKNYTRNLHFRSSNYEITWSAIYDLIPYERKFRYRVPFTPYAHGGVGFTFFSPQAKLNGKWTSLRPLQTEGKKYNIVTPVVSYGAGIRYKATPKLNISIELGYRWTFTDYLDDVSTVYTDNSALTSSEAKLLADRSYEVENLNKEFKDYDYATQTWNKGHQRGNPKRKDGYILFGFKVEYTLKYTSQNGGMLRMTKFK